MKLNSKASKMRKTNKISKANYLNQKGVTLIALVITIVVLLILAGVSINAIFSENGIINKAKDAQNKMDQATQNDLDTIDHLNNWITDQTGDVPDILKRYILGEDKKGILATEIIDLSNAPDSFKAIGNDIIPDAETSMEFKDFNIQNNIIGLVFKYNNRYYIATADEETYITKSVQPVKNKEIYEGINIIKDKATDITSIIEKVNPSKQYKVEYTENGESKIGVTHTELDLKYIVLSIQLNSGEMFFYEKYAALKGNSSNSIIIRKIYEIGDATNCVEENGFIALLNEEQNEWELCGSPNIEYNIPKTVKGKEISRVLMDCLDGTPVFTEKISIGGTGEPISLKKIIVKISDENFISKLFTEDYLDVEEIDLSECGDNIEIPASFFTSYNYQNVKIYVSPAVKANYEAYDNIIAK